MKKKTGKTIVKSIEEVCKDEKNGKDINNILIECFKHVSEHEELDTRASSIKKIIDNYLENRK